MASPLYEDEMLKTNTNILKLEKSLEKLRKGNSSMDLCIDYLENLSSSQQMPLFYVGGFVRDLWLGVEPKDVDVVLFHSSQEKHFKNLTKEYINKKNSLGGFKLNIEGVSVDVWSLDSTFSFTKKDSVFYPLNCISNLPQETFFNIDGIVLEVYAPD